MSSWHPPSPVTLQAIWLMGLRVCLKLPSPQAGGMMLEFQSHTRLWNLSLHICRGFRQIGCKWEKLKLGWLSNITAVTVSTCSFCDIVNDFPLKTSPPLEDNRNRMDQGTYLSESVCKRSTPKIKKNKSRPNPTTPSKILWIVKRPESGGLVLTRISLGAPGHYQSSHSPSGVYLAFSRIEHYCFPFTVLETCLCWGIIDFSSESRHLSHCFPFYMSEVQIP